MISNPYRFTCEGLKGTKGFLLVGRDYGMASTYNQNLLKTFVQFKSCLESPEYEDFLFDSCKFCYYLKLLLLCYAILCIWIVNFNIFVFLCTGQFETNFILYT